MEIRFAKPSDISIIDEMYVHHSMDEAKVQYPKKSVKILEKEFSKAKRERIKEFKKELKNKKNNMWIIGYVDDNFAIGLGHAKKINNGTWKIEKIYVEKKHRRNGYGSRMLGLLLQELERKGVKKVDYGVYIKNIPSINLAKKFGFKETSMILVKELV